MVTLANSRARGLLLALALTVEAACFSPKLSDSVLPKNPPVPEPSAPVESTRAAPEHSEGVVRVQNTLAELERFDRGGRNRNLEQVYFELPESDFNEYLAYALHTTPRPGVEEVRIKLHAGNRVSVSVVMNFDQIAEWVPVIPSLLHLSGKQTLTMNLVFTVQDAAVMLQLESTGKEPWTRPALQTLLHVLALHQPERYDTSQPIPLPYGLQKLSTTEGMLMGGT